MSTQTLSICPSVFVHEDLENAPEWTNMNAHDEYDNDYHRLKTTVYLYCGPNIITEKYFLIITDDKKAYTSGMIVIRWDDIDIEKVKESAYFYTQHNGEIISIHYGELCVSNMKNHVISTFFAFCTKHNLPYTSMHIGTLIESCAPRNLTEIMAEKLADNSNWIKRNNNVYSSSSVDNKETYLLVFNDNKTLYGNNQLLNENCNDHELNGIAILSKRINGPSLFSKFKFNKAKQDTEENYDFDYSTYHEHIGAKHIVFHKFLTDNMIYDEVANFCKINNLPNV